MIEKELELKYKRQLKSFMSKKTRKPFPAEIIFYIYEMKGKGFNPFYFLVRFYKCKT